MATSNIEEKKILKPYIPGQVYAGQITTLSINTGAATSITTAALGTEPASNCFACIKTVYCNANQLAAYGVIPNSATALYYRNDSTANYTNKAARLEISLIDRRFIEFR